MEWMLLVGYLCMVKHTTLVLVWAKITVGAWVDTNFWVIHVLSKKCSSY